jgi:hypothetical protein
MENKIVDRIRKFLALAANNNSPEEAAQAAARAQELMFQYQIGEADLDMGEAKREVEEVVNESVHDAGRQREVWKAALANSIAKSFGCVLYTDQTGDKTKYQVVGLKSVVQTVGYMFSYLSNEISRLADAAWAQEKGSSLHSARTWKNSFRLGAVNTVYKRLKEQQGHQEQKVAAMVQAAKAAPTASKSTALALYKSDQERVADTYQELRKSKRLRTKRSTYRHSASAYERGQAAGNSLGLGGGKGLNAPAKQVR